jgi:prepilin-type N-terminal cleavage/methylation domain-containing protein
MEFKTTSTNPRHRRQAGFTLVELMVAAALSGLLLAVCASLTLYTARGIASVTDSVDLNARSRLAIDRMSQKLRQASGVKSFSPTAVTVTFNGRPLSYTYLADRRVLVENDAGVTNTLVENCDRLTFNYYKRNPMTNSFNQFPILTATNEAKVIQVNWFCSRTLVGKKSGAAEMVSAKIVLRAK